MKQSEKLKVLIDSIKTANELMRKQIEINGRAVELLGEFITEPESLSTAPHSDNVPSLSGFNIVGQEIELGNEWVKDETIKPEDMKAGEWYVLTLNINNDYLEKKWIIKFIKIDGLFIYSEKCVSFNNLFRSLDLDQFLIDFFNIRKATQEEILKYFPDELEVPTHGGNDAGHIASLTDLQLKKLIDIQL